MPSMNTPKDNNYGVKIKYDLSAIPKDFLSSNVAMSSLTENINDSTNLDDLYDSFCEIIKVEMRSKLPHKTIKICSSSNNKMRYS